MSKKAIIFVACPDRGAGNDPEALGSAFQQSPTFIKAYCQAATNLVNRDSQRGLHSPSASSSH